MSLPDFSADSLSNVIYLLSILVFSIVSCPWVVLVYVPIGLLFYWYRLYFKRTSTELKRLDSVTRSPIFSIFGETLTGLSTIRAFGMQDAFCAAHRALVHANTRVFFLSYMAGRWIAVRVECVATLVIGVLGLFGVLLKDTINPGVIGLALVYTLQMAGLLQYTVRLSIDFENAMTSVERVLSYATLESEAPAEIKTTTPPSSWPERGAITIDAVRLRYGAVPE